MKSKNKKTNNSKKKVRVSKKAVKPSLSKALVRKEKKVKRKSAKAATAGSYKKESVFGSYIPKQSESIGTKIEVREIKDESPVVSEDIVREIIGEEKENILPPATEIQTEQDFEFDSDDEGVNMSQEDAIVEEYYAQKQLSPRQKNIIMYISLTAIMGVLIVFWGLSIKNSMSQVVFSNQAENDNMKLFDEFQDSFASIKDEIQGIASQNTNSDLKNQALDQLNQQIVTEKVKDDIANQLKEKLENLNTDGTNINNTNSN